MKKNLNKLLAALLALILSAVPALAISYSFITIPMSGEGVGEFAFVSTRRCLVVKDGCKEYFGFRAEDGKLIFTNADGVETKVAIGEGGKGALALALANGETFTADIASIILSGIINNGVLPIEKGEFYVEFDK